ncbi:MAG TPA: hypothetical protein VF245_06855 [Solirubrobacterales bacterium]
MTAVPAAFPFIQVKIDTSGLTPVAQRAPGVIAVVGSTPAGTAGGSADLNTPLVVETPEDAANLFSKTSASGTAGTPLHDSLMLALLQEPKPSKIYGVRAAPAGDDRYAAALSALEAVDDVTLVSLAAETEIGSKATGSAAATGLMALKDHCESMSAAGHKRIGFGMIDPARAKSDKYADEALAAVESLKSDTSRMVMVAARAAAEDAATAAMASAAGLAPHVSTLLKPVRGVKMPKPAQYSPSEIRALSEGSVIPLIEPETMVGEMLRFAEGRCFTSDPDLLYVDIVRTLDDVDFRLKAGLIGSIGDARITKPGMTLVKARTEGILDPLLRGGEIAGYALRIPVLDVLSTPESTWTPADRATVTTARANRTVEMFVSITYGPATHRLQVTLAPSF